MKKYYIKLTTHYRLEDGSYGKILTEPTEYYQEAVNQYNEIISRVKNKVVHSQRDVKYNNGYYENFFRIQLISQDYSYGCFRGFANSVKGDLEIYIGKYMQ